MFNIKVCAFAAIIAFVLSLLTGLISRNVFPAVIIKPLVFAAVFFGLSAFINIIISKFLPELLDGSAADADQSQKFSLPGENINISEDDITGFGMNQAAISSDDSDENLGDIASIDDNMGPAPGFSALDNSVSRGMDQNSKGGYNSGEGLDSFSQAAGVFVPDGMPPAIHEKHKESGPPMNVVPLDIKKAGANDVLSDLDSLANAFSSSHESNPGEDSSEDYESSESFTDSLVKKTSSGSKSQKLDWDFNPKDMAQGIRTKISKEG